MSRAGKTADLANVFNRVLRIQQEATRSSDFVVIDYILEILAGAFVYHLAQIVGIISKMCSGIAQSDGSHVITDIRENYRHLGMHTAVFGEVCLRAAESAKQLSEKHCYIGIADLGGIPFTAERFTKNLPYY